MSLIDKKKKILDKYLDNPNSSKKKPTNNNNINNYDANVWMKDEDQIAPLQQSSSQQISEVEQKRARIYSSDEGDNAEDQIKSKKKKNKQRQQQRQSKKQKKQRKLKKKIRKALGLQKDEDMDQFLNNLQVQGIQKQQILQYVKSNKQVIIKKQNEQPKQKKRKKKDKKQDEVNKFQMFQKEQSSDLQIPQQARAKTIYRNKDGTIRQQSQKQQKEKRKKQVLDRLSQWQKGMKKQKSQSQNQYEDVDRVKNNKIWHDPMKRWQQQEKVTFLQCRFQAPPNRYNIKPGYRWDGVVRGNGYQNRYLQQINLKKAKKEKQHMEYMKDL